MRLPLAVCSMAVALLVWVGTVGAGTDLGLWKDHYPEVTICWPYISYSAGTHYFEATGVPE